MANCRGGAAGWMLRGQDLQDAERWIASHPRGAPEPTELHRDFIAQSRRVATRRQRLTLAGSVVGAVVGFGLAGLAYWQRSIAVRQRDELQHQQAKDTHRHGASGNPFTPTEDTVRIWDVHFAAMSAKALLVETCAHGLPGFSRLSRDEMRLGGYSDETPEKDVCTGVE